MNDRKQEVAVFGGGCFWCIEAVFERLEGVSKVVSGYAGGQTPHPSYEDVCTGRTGHAEVIQITFDPATISYRDLVEMFFAFHDPTTLNRQGADTGTQYRSAIFYTTPEQKTTAEQVIGELAAQKSFTNKIVTEVAPLREFYAAEEYHQGYFRKNPTQGYCRATIPPKLAKLRQKYSQRLKKEAAAG